MTIFNDLIFFSYFRIESIETLEPFGFTQRKQIILVDNEDVKIKFLLWGEQVLLANLFRSHTFQGYGLVFCSSRLID